VSVEKPRRKKRTSSGEKKTLSEAKDKLIAEIPPVRRIRPVVVKPETVIVPVHVENVQVAVGVGFACRAIRSTACAIRRNAVFYLRSKIDQRGTPSLFFFEKHDANPPRKALTVRALNLRLRERSRRTVAIRCNRSKCILSPRQIFYKFRVFVEST
jgi:hypothetical protein